MNVAKGSERFSLGEYSLTVQTKEGHLPSVTEISSYFIPFADLTIIYYSVVIKKKGLHLCTNMLNVSVFLGL